MTGGFSRSIDIIQSQYGWPDEKLLNLPICRVRQIIEVISQRKIEEVRVSARMVEWQTKSLAAMLVGLAQDEKQAKAMSRMVEKMVLPMADESKVDTRPIEQVIEEGALVDIDSQPTFGDLSAALGAQAR